MGYYWFIGPILATIIGAVSGAHFYLYAIDDTTIYNHSDIVVPNIIPPSEHAKDMEIKKNSGAGRISGFESQNL